MTSRRTGWPIVFVLVVAVLALAARPGDGRPAQATPRPAIIATVDLERAFDKLEERSTEDAALAALAGKLKADGDELAALIASLEEEIEAYVPGTDKYKTTLEKLQRTSLEYQSLVEFSRRKIDLRKADVLRRIYGSIKDAARQLAEEKGYDVVFVDDSIDDVESGTEVDVRRQISARRMLYTNPDIDVTDELIARMNERYRPKGP